jgi:hypothetical protein
MDRLCKAGSALVYRCSKQRSEPGSFQHADKRGNKADELNLTPLRAAVTALATPVQPVAMQAEPASTPVAVQGSAPLGNALPTTPEPVQPKCPAHYLWVVLIARIYEVFPLLCPQCGGQMRLIAFITHSVEIRHNLNHIGQESEPPHNALARGPPLWDECDALVDDGAKGEPD